MGETTGISWCHHTANPWTGCTKVSEGCKNCYAERDTLRWGLKVFGPKADRQMRAEPYWKQLPKWNREAIEACERRRCFIMSFGDIWEPRSELVAPRARMLGLIEECTSLDFLMLSKRIADAPTLLEEAGFGHWMRDGWPANALAMVSAENDKRLVERCELLVDIPARVRGLSCEPLLGQLNSLRTYLAMGDIHFAIAGGESGPRARPMHPMAAMGILADCAATGAAFWWKQWGKWVPGYVKGKKHCLVHIDGTFEDITDKAASEHPSAFLKPNFEGLYDDQVMHATGYTEGELGGQIVRQLPATRLIEVGRHQGRGCTWPKVLAGMKAGLVYHRALEGFGPNTVVYARVHAGTVQFWLPSEGAWKSEVPNDYDLTAQTWVEGGP